MDQIHTTQQQPEPSDSQASAQTQTQLLQQLEKDFNGNSNGNNVLTDGELAEEMSKKPGNPLEAILEAEQKKELRLNDARKTLNLNGKSKEEILSRYPENPFESS